MTAVVGMDFIKQALLLGACDTGLGGICIAGKRGTCKVDALRSRRPPLPFVGDFALPNPHWCRHKFLPS